MSRSDARLSFQCYEVLLHWPFNFKLQLHVSKYDVGDFLKEHTDIVALGRMLRILIILRSASKGGQLQCEHFVVNWPRLKIFEPGRYEHPVTKVEKEQRLVLNFGVWVAQRRSKKTSER